MLEHPEVTLRAIAVGASLIAIYGSLAGVACRLAGESLRWDEKLALGACLPVVAGTLAGLSARTLLALDARTALQVPHLNLDVGAALVVLVPLAALLVLLPHQRSSIEFRSLARRIVPHAALVVAVTALVASVGVNAVFRSDADRRAQAVKELVWANRLVTTAGEPVLPSENAKYGGYLAARAIVTRLGGSDPWKPSLAWVMIAATGMAAGLVALVRNLGLPRWTAGVALASMPLLGGDAYRLESVGDPRAVAAMIMIAGLAVLARAMTASSSTGLPAAFGGALTGASALAHLQYVVIAGSVVFPALILGLCRRRLWRLRARHVVIASAVVSAVLLLGLAHGSSLVDSTTLAETAAERVEGETVTHKDLLTSGRSEWPPRSVTVDGVRLLYQSPSLYAVHPSRIFSRLWGGRTSALLAITGLAAVLLLRRRVSSFLLPLIGGTVLIPVVVLFNPIVFPYFHRYFGVYRAELIGFELAFVGLAAVGAAVAVHRARAVPLAVVALLATVPIVDATIEWHREIVRERKAIEQNPALQSFRDLQRWARYEDLILGSPAAVSHAVSVETESRFARLDSLRPNPLEAETEARAVLRSLDRLDAERVIVVVDETTPPASAIRRLIQAGRIQSAVGADGALGVYWMRVDLL